MITEQMGREMLEYMTKKPYQDSSGSIVYSYPPNRDVLDLNFLFEVAEKLCFIDVCISKHKDYYVACVGWNEEIEREICADAKDKAEALFLALYQTIKEMK